MACVVTITSVTATLPGPSVTVKGQAQDCKQVKVTLTCTTGASLAQTVVVVGSLWEATFPDADKIACLCDDKFVVTAECVDPNDPNCIPDKVEGKLVCEGETCPSVSITKLLLGDCTDGATPLTIEVTLNAAGSYSAELKDSVNGVLDTVSGTGPQVLSHTGNYSGTVLFEVVVTSPANCPGLSLPITFPSCPECPNVTWSSSVGDCIDNGAHRSVTVTAQLSSPDAYVARLRDASMDLDTVSVPAASPPQTLSHTGTYPAGSSQAFQVVIDSPDVCNASNLTVEVGACGGDGGDGGDGDGGESLGCLGLRVIMTIAAILAVVAAAVALCNPALGNILWWVAGGFAVLAAIAGILWGIFCSKPCGWGLLLTWQVAIGAGLILLCFTVCCPIFWFIGLGLVLIGLLLLNEWKKRCKQSNCAVAKELVIAVSGVVLPLLGWLGVIPLLAACINHVVTGLISTLAAAIAIYASHCNN